MLFGDSSDFKGQSGKLIPKTLEEAARKGSFPKALHILESEES